MANTPINTSFVSDIKNIIQEARQKTVVAINTVMVSAYWQIGKRIVEEEQNGTQRAEYGKQLLSNLALSLRADFGKTFDARELRKMRQFYSCFPIRDAVRPELSWTHYRLLIRVENTAARNFYIQETIGQHWSTRKLDRNIGSQYFQRTLAHQDIGQLDMYVRMFDDLEKRESDNSTIGILLCADTDNVVAKYSVLNDNNQLFASKYQLYLPTTKELQNLIEKTSK